MNEPISSSNCLSKRRWEQLLGSVTNGLVVPVIGPELLVDGVNGSRRNFYDVWGDVILEDNETSLEFQPDTPRLYQATNHLLYNSVKRVNTAGGLAFNVHSVVDRAQWQIPEPLLQLASIHSLRLLVTTTIDHLLWKAMEKKDSERARKVAFAPRGDKSRIDLPAGFESNDTRIVYSLFGSSSCSPKTFAATEDDLIEFSWSLLDRQYAPERFYDFLNGKTVLLLGCNFPDWLGRFFVHAIQSDQEGIKVIYVSQRDEPGLSSFLTRRDGTVLAPCDPVEFVGELYRRWTLTQSLDTVIAPKTSPPSMKRGAVFISYAKEDREAARAIRAELEKALIDTWMDENELEGGDRWEQVIEDRIADASFFLAVISRNLDPKAYRGGERFVLREWGLGLTSDTKRDPSAKFLRPVCIDQTPCTASFANRFSGVHWHRLEAGRLGESFINSLREGVRHFRRTAA